MPVKFEITVIKDTVAMDGNGMLYDIDGLQIFTKERRTVIYRPDELDDDGDDFFKIACPVNTRHKARLLPSGNVILE